MQIGQKMVKVQKIIMPKAAVEDMQKKGYLEMKVRSIQSHRSFQGVNELMMSLIIQLLK